MWIYPLRHQCPLRSSELPTRIFTCQLTQIWHCFDISLVLAVRFLASTNIRCRNVVLPVFMQCTQYFSVITFCIKSCFGAREHKTKTSWWSNGYCARQSQMETFSSSLNDGREKKKKNTPVLNDMFAMQSGDEWCHDVYARLQMVVGIKSTWHWQAPKGLGPSVSPLPNDHHCQWFVGASHRFWCCQRVAAPSQLHTIKKEPLPALPAMSGSQSVRFPEIGRRLHDIVYRFGKKTVDRVGSSRSAYDPWHGPEGRFF